MLEISLDQQRSAGPVYRQIAGQIRGAIEGQGLARGDRLPTIRELSERLGVNRDTVALAYDELARDGLVEATVGRGTFVTGSAAVPAFTPPLSPLIERLLVLERARPRFGSAHGAVALHSVVPDPRLYPAEAFRKTLNRELQKGGAELLLYGEPQGLLRLRRAVAAHLTAIALVVSPDELVLCHGASQGIALALRLFGLPADFLSTLGYLPLIFFGAAVPTPMRAVAITLWSFLYPENPAQATAFGLVQHNFFIFFNASIGLLFLKRANRELFGKARST